jgi:hypothetical protein
MEATAPLLDVCSKRAKVATKIERNAARIAIQIGRDAHQLPEPG